MRRAFKIIIRGAYRKKYRRESRVPCATTEEIRQEQKTNEARYAFPTLCETLGWTAGLAVSCYYLDKKRPFCPDQLNHVVQSKTSGCSGIVDQRPSSFRGLRLALCVPSPTTTTNDVIPRRSSRVRTESIDASPFLPEESLQLTISDGSFGTSISSNSDDEDDFGWDSQLSLLHELDEIEKPQDPALRSFASNVLNFLGVGAALLPKQSNSNFTGGTDPPLSAIELLKLGAELGNHRNYYNLGVLFERTKQMEEAREYYRRASELGHPLASYNYAVMLLKEKPKSKPTSEIISLMTYAAENGVPEAVEFAKFQKSSKAKQPTATCNSELGSAVSTPRWEAETEKLKGLQL